MNVTKIVSALVCVFMLVLSAHGQEKGYVELNAGMMHYNSKQNNWEINPTFGVNLNRQFRPHFSMELYYSGAAINETVVYSSKNGTTNVKNKRFVASWIGLRALIGKNTDTWSFNVVPGLAVRADNGATALELGVKYSHRLYRSFWVHSSVYVQSDGLANNTDPYYSAPLNASYFGNVKLGIAYHFK